MLERTAAQHWSSRRGTGKVTVADDSLTFSADNPFLATGVSPNTDDIGLDVVDGETDTGGGVVVDETFQTANPDEYAAIASANRCWRPSPPRKGTTR